MNFRFIIILVALAGAIVETSAQTKKSIDYYTDAVCVYEYALKLNNDPYYLNKAMGYCLEASKQCQNSVELASIEVLKRDIELKINTCEQNMNHKFEFFSFFKGIPSNYGFADDNIEYSFENGFDELLGLPFFGSATPLEKTNGYSIVVYGNLDEEMYDINFQQLTSSVSQYVLPRAVLYSLIGKGATDSLLRNRSEISPLQNLCERLGIDRIGIYEGSFSHEVDGIIATECKYYLYNNETEKLSNPLIAYGFSEDRRGLLGWSLFLLISISLLTILLLQFVEYLIDNIRIMSRRTLISYFHFDNFKGKLLLAVASQLIPMLIALILIFATSSLVPEDSTHFMESEAIFWYVMTALLLSIIPTFLTFLIVNKIDIDGFHTVRGYQSFLTASLYGSLSPLFIWYIIKYQDVPHWEHVFVLINSMLIGWVFGKALELFFKRNKSNGNKVIGMIGTVLVLISILNTAWFLLSEISRDNILTITVGSSLSLFAFLLFNKTLGRRGLLKNSDDTFGLEDRLLPINSSFFESEKLWLELTSTPSNRLLLRGYRGIGKTTYFKDFFLPQFQNAELGYCFYCDCDQFTPENGISYEPFVEAFGVFLGISAIEDSSAKIGNISSSLPFSLIDERLGDALKTSGKTVEKTGEDFIIDLLNKLAAQTKGSIILIMEDIQWIDSESQRLLRFLLTLLENEKYRSTVGSRFRIILTEGITASDKSNLISVVDSWIPDEFRFLDFGDFCRIKDFVWNAFNQKVSSISANSIKTVNDLMNASLAAGRPITPRFIQQVLQRWIESGILADSENGKIITEVVSLDDLPNPSDLTDYYKSVIENLPPMQSMDYQRSIRILESAAYLGSRFDATILADLWNIDLLVLLDYFSVLEQKRLIHDESDYDNLYSFVDYAFVIALKSQFKDHSSNRNHRKQIVVEYHKRWIKLRLGSSEAISKRTTEELMELSSKFHVVIHSEEMVPYYNRLISNLAIRFLLQREFSRVVDLIQTHKEFLNGHLLSSIESHLNFWMIGDDQFNEVYGDYNQDWLNTGGLLRSGLSDKNYSKLSTSNWSNKTQQELEYYLFCLVECRLNFEDYILNTQMLLDEFPVDKRGPYWKLLAFKIQTSDYYVADSKNPLLETISDLQSLIISCDDATFESFASIHLNQYWIESDNFEEVYTEFNSRLEGKRDHGNLLWVYYFISVEPKMVDAKTAEILKLELERAKDYLELRGLDKFPSALNIGVLKMSVSLHNYFKDYDIAIQELDQFIDGHQFESSSDPAVQMKWIELLLLKASVYASLKDDDSTWVALVKALELSENFPNSSIRIDALIHASRHMRLKRNEEKEALELLVKANSYNPMKLTLSKRRLGLLQFQTAQAYLEIGDSAAALNYYIGAQGNWSNTQVGQFRRLITDCKIAICTKESGVDLISIYDITMENLIASVKQRLNEIDTESLVKKFGGAAAIKEFLDNWS